MVYNFLLVGGLEDGWFTNIVRGLSGHYEVYMNL